MQSFGSSTREYYVLVQPMFDYAHPLSRSSLSASAPPGVVAAAGQPPPYWQTTSMVCEGPLQVAVLTPPQLGLLLPMHGRLM